jgi:protein-tyrosine phosphatase
MAYKILFVCTGNICRSPTAHAAMRHAVQAAGMAGQVVVDSAATNAYHTGEPPDRRSIAAARVRGIVMDDLRARSLVPGDADEFDLILAMDRGHLSHIQKMIPAGRRARTGMFMDFAPGGTGEDVPDPYYGGARDFEIVLDMVERAVAGLMTHVQRFDAGKESV